MVETYLAPHRFNLTIERKDMAKLPEPIKISKPSPIVFVPDTTYVDDTGQLIPTNLIVVSDSELYNQFAKGLEQARKEVPRQTLVVDSKMKENDDGIS